MKGKDKAAIWLKWNRIEVYFCQAVKRNQNKKNFSSLFKFIIINLLIWWACAEKGRVLKVYKEETLTEKEVAWLGPKINWC